MPTCQQVLMIASIFCPWVNFYVQQYYFRVMPPKEAEIGALHRWQTLAPCDRNLPPILMSHRALQKSFRSPNPDLVRRVPLIRIRSALR